jgi:hypothetical protein
LGSLTSQTKRDFGDGEKNFGKKDFGQIHIVKSHFEGRDFGDGERLRERGKNSGKKDFGQIHLCEVSLRRRRETSKKKRDFGETFQEERLRGINLFSYIIGPARTFDLMIVFVVI